MLGPFRVAIDGVALDDLLWTRKKPKQLLKLLALQSHHQYHREQLMELLWPDCDPEAAGNNLHKAIHLARHVLEPHLCSGANSSFIQTHQQTVHLSAPTNLWIDVEAFETAAVKALKSTALTDLQEALGLYQDDLLIEDPFEEWLAKPRERLSSLHRLILKKVAAACEANGGIDEAIEALKQLVELDVADEESHRQLMRLYAVTGHRQSALQQYQRCINDLRRELDAQPEAGTKELYEQILAGVIKPPKRNEQPQVRNRSSVAVLPFENVTTDETIEYLSDGITEGTIRLLSHLPGLRVMAWSTVSRYKAKVWNAAQVRQDLGVEAVLTGRVLLLSDRLVVKVELVDTADGAVLWAEEYVRAVGDTALFEAELSREISKRLSLKLTRDETMRLARHSTVNVDAYHSYLKGRYFWNKRTTSGLRKGVECFKQAIDADPAYALAYAGLADSYTNLVTWESLRPEDGLAKAKAAAEAALGIDESLAEAHAALGHARLHCWEWVGSETALRRALELNSGYAPAHNWLSEYLSAIGNFDEALQHAERAQQLEPLSLLMSTDIGRTLFLARRYDEAIASYTKTLELEPTYFLARYHLGHAYAQKGMHLEAIGELEQAIALTGGSPLSGLLIGNAYALAGKREAAELILSDLKKLANERYFSPYRVATIYAPLGDLAQAFEWLQRALAVRDAWLIWLKVDPALDNLRSDERYDQLIRGVGLDRF